MEENGRLIKFLYNEDSEVVAEETSNGTITRYIRGLGIISSDSDEAKTYYHYVSDEQGSITHVLSEDAEILNHYNSDEEQHPKANAAGAYQSATEKGNSKSGTETRDIYRAVSSEELDDIFATGGFRARPDGRSFQAKKFGNSFDETLDFANKPINLDKVAIVKVTIPENVYNQLHHMNLIVLYLSLELL